MALRSKFANKEHNLFRATKIFTDRIDARTVFSESIDTWMSRNKPSEVIVYYGIGGIGKSRLLKELYSTTDKYYKENTKNINNVYVSLDTFDCSNITNTLIKIRSQLKIDCSLFDYAYMEYNAKSNISVEDLKNKMTSFNSPIIEVLNECIDLGTGSIAIPSNLLSKAVEFVKKRNFNKQYHEYIEEIHTLMETEIYERLPYYLGICIQNAAQKGEYNTIFIDSYESLLTSSRYKNNEEEWLQELFLSSENIRIIVASRDKLKWEEQDKEWSEYLNQHLLSRLSVEDSISFLKHVPIEDETIIKKMVKSSKGMPLFLDMYVDMYTSDFNSGKTINKDNFKAKGDTIISRYIKYLNDNEKSAVKLLSLLDCFDKEFAQDYLESEKIFMLNNELNSLYNKSIFIEDTVNKNLIRIDSSVREYIKKEISDSQATQFTEKLICCIEKIKNNIERSFKYFGQVIEIEKDFNINSENISDKLIELMQYFMDMGYWNEIYKIFNQAVETSNECFETMRYFANVFYMKRTEKLTDTKQYIQKFEGCHKLSDNQKYLNEYLRAHTEHLLGNYDIALELYKKLYEEMNLIKECVSIHTFNAVMIKYIDVLFLKGKFKTSLNMIEEMLNNKNINTSEKIELLRTKGHIYRFNLMFNESEKIYNAAYKLIEKQNSKSFEGKIYTNMSEALCIINPIKSLEFAQKSLDINKQLGNSIEIGKAYSASCIAKSLLNNYENATIDGNNGIKVEEIVGYKSGVLFCNFALLICAYSCNNTEDVLKMYNNIKLITDDIKVYTFLEKYAKILTDKNPEKLKELTDFEWLDINNTINVINNLIA